MPRLSPHSLVCTLLCLAAAPVLLAAQEPVGVKLTAEEVRRGTEANNRIKQDIAKDFHGSAGANCSIDMRQTIPACKQAGMDWCWATGIAEFSFYYNVSTPARGDNCSSAECGVVSFDLKTQCCPYKEHIGCGADSAEVQHIVEVATEYVKRQFKSEGAPLSEDQLKATLMSETPVMPIISWQKGGGHALLVAGCEPGLFGETSYYLHDPERNYYEKVGYMRLLEYSALQPGKWVDTVYSAAAKN